MDLFGFEKELSLTREYIRAPNLNFRHEFKRSSIYWWWIEKVKDLFPLKYMTGGPIMNKRRLLDVQNVCVSERSCHAVIELPGCVIDRNFGL